MMNTDWLLICKTVGPLTAKNADANVYVCRHFLSTDGTLAGVGATGLGGSKAGR